MIQQFGSVTQSCPTLCDPMNRSLQGLPFHHQLTESTQTHVYESVMPSNHLILCRPLLLLSSIFPSIRVFSNESALFASGGQSIGSFSFNISPSNEHPVLNSSQSKGLSKVFSITTIQKHQFFGQLCLWTDSHISTCYWKNNSFGIRDLRWQSDAFALKYTVYFYDTFPLKEQAVFSFTDCSETPAASPSHWPHAGLISLQPAPRLQAATARAHSVTHP